MGEWNKETKTEHSKITTGKCGKCILCILFFPHILYISRYFVSSLKYIYICIYIYMINWWQETYLAPQRVNNMDLLQILRTLFWEPRGKDSEFRLRPAEFKGPCDIQGCVSRIQGLCMSEAQIITRDRNFHNHNLHIGIMRPPRKTAEGEEQRFNNATRNCM